MLQSFTLVPWLETDYQCTVADACSGDDTESGNLGIALHFLQPQHMFLNLRHDLVGLHERRTGGSRHVNHEHTLVLLRHQSCRQRTHSQYHGYNSSNQPYPSAAWFLQEFSHTGFIFVQDGIIARLIGLFDPLVETFLAVRRLFLGTEKNGGQCRTEGQRRDTTQTYRTGDRDTELGEESTARTGHEGHRDKHRHEDQRTADDSYGDFAHRVFGCLVRRGVAVLHLRHYRLDDHNGIIHHGSDRQHQGKERKDIERETRNLHYRKRT